MEIALSSQLQMQSVIEAPRTRARRSRKSIIPGFGLTMGFTLAWLSLIVLVGPGAIAGGLVTFALLWLIGPVVVVPAALVCFAIIAVELALATEMLGGAYDRIDVSQVERSE